MADEEMYEAQARDWLESVDTPPPRLQVAEIVQIGQRQVRRRRMLAVSGTAAMLAAVAAIPATVRIWPDRTSGYLAGGPVLDCTVTELAIPEGESQEIGVTGMDPTGRYLVGHGTHFFGTDPVTEESINEPAVTVLWRDGEPTYIPALRGTIEVADVNSHGVVVGVGHVLRDPEDDEEPRDPVESMYGWVYSDGEVRELPAPAGFGFVHVGGINDAGDIVGSVTNANGVGLAVVWRSVSGDEDIDQPEILPAPDGTWAHTADIAEDGTVVGTLSRNELDPQRGSGYLWEPDGGGRELPPPAGTTGGSATAVSGDWVIGTAYVQVPEGSVEPPAPAVPSLSPPAPYEGGPPSAVQLPVRWNLRTGSVELIDPGARPWRQFDIQPADVSDSGDFPISDLSAPLLLRGDQWFTLPFDGVEARPNAISADGTTIAGEVYLAPRTYADESKRVPVVWRC